MLTLPIKKKWFDLILSGKKKEEYREIKPYYKLRFKTIFEMYPYSYNPHGLDEQKIIFRNGYSKDSPSFVAKCKLSIGYGYPGWGAVPMNLYYVLSIGEISDVKGVNNART